ncbi:hypothetical protein [Mycolicibacterium litorale]|uniref:hypothetical protein n=1 Tax=Mycolicibacterium litorale TaxID=758802 RepID=UPI0013D13451|nr:hypothetical protein [Mycolicibacterium litorale]MCV7417481.1 hypothetical protein [Mycolicibacterium litorale]
MRSLPITATGRLLRRVQRALDVPARQNPGRCTPEAEVPVEDVSIVERELTRC